MRKTNPIPRLQISDYGLRIQDRPAAGRRLRPATRSPAGLSRETNPIWLVGPPANENVRNEPNLRPPRGIGGASPTLHVDMIAPNEPNSAKPAGGPGRPRAETCKTKPILRLRIAHCRNGTGQPASAFGGVVGLRIQDRPAAGHSLQPGTRHPGVDCAKRSQFARQGRAGWGWRGAGRGVNAQNEPNSRHGRAGRGPEDESRGRTMVQNEPNSGKPGQHPGVDCAKRSQFRLIRF